MTTLTSGNFVSEPFNPLKGLVDALAAFFKTPKAEEDQHHYRTTQEEIDLRRELRMLGGS